jgi:hypothetical protein
MECKTKWVDRFLAAGLIPSDLRDNTNYNIVLSKNEDYIAIAYPSTDTGQGCVYTFMLNDGKWYKDSTITADFRVKYSYFGHCIAMNNDATIMTVSSIRTNPLGYNNNGVYIFTRKIGGLWIQEEQLICKSKFNDNFGFSLSINATGHKLVIGSPNCKRTGYSSVYDIPGAVYLYNRSIDSKWRKVKKFECKELYNPTLGYKVKINDIGTVITSKDELGLTTAFALKSGQWVEMI